MFCAKCGAEMDDKAVICVKCGVTTDNSTETVGKTKKKKKLYQRWWFWVITVVLVIVVVKLMNRNSGRPMKLSGQVIQVLGDSYRVDASKTTGDSAYDNVIVSYNTSDSEIKEADYIMIDGDYLGTTYYKSAIGMDVTAQKIRAKTVTRSTYIEAVSPSLKTVDVNETKTQKGYSVTLQKIEFAAKETRLYIKVKNKGKAKFNLYEFNAVITQKGKQFKEQSNYDADYPELEDDIRTGITTEGIIAFPKLQQSSLKVILEASSSNWDETIKDFVFNVSVK